MIDLSALGVRDWILVAAVLVGAYLFLSLLPLLRVGRRHPPPSVPQDMDGDSGVSREIRHHMTPGAQATGLPDERSSTSPSVFARELAHSSLELEVGCLRREMDAMAVEMVRMGEEMRQLKASRNVSPVYSEAMTLAQHGEAPAGIAAQCGISIGEAELVAALARSGSGAEFDDKADDQHSGGRTQSG